MCRFDTACFGTLLAVLGQFLLASIDQHSDFRDCFAASDAESNLHLSLSVLTANLMYINIWLRHVNHCSCQAQIPIDVAIEIIIGISVLNRWTHNLVAVTFSDRLDLTGAVRCSLWVFSLVRLDEVDSTANVLLRLKEVVVELRLSLWLALFKASVCSR